MEEVRLTGPAGDMSPGLAKVRALLQGTPRIWAAASMEAEMLSRCIAYVGGLLGAGEGVLHAWLVTSVNEWALPQERVLVLTSSGLHRLRFDRESTSVLKHSRMPLRSIIYVGHEAGATIVHKNSALPRADAVKVYSDAVDGRRSLKQLGWLLKDHVDASLCTNEEPLLRPASRRLYSPIAPALRDGATDERAVTELCSELAWAVRAAVAGGADSVATRPERSTSFPTLGGSQEAGRLPGRTLADWSAVEDGGSGGGSGVRRGTGSSGGLTRRETDDDFL